MKKVCLLFLLLIVLFGMSSCMDQFYVTQKSSFDRSIKTVQTQLAQQGYELSGTSTNTRNETVVTDRSYSSDFGYGFWMDNKFITQDTYKFTDSLGNTMSYSLSYQAKQTDDEVSYVTNVELCGCETSNPKDYEKMCGDEAVVKQFNNMPKDRQIRVKNKTKTYWAASGITAVTAILLLCILYRFN